MGLSRGAVSVTGTGGTPCHYEVVRAEARSNRSGLLDFPDAMGGRRSPLKGRWSRPMAFLKGGDCMDQADSALQGAIRGPIGAEIVRAASGEIRAYLQGASRDGTFNRSHRTLRISQADVRWLRVLGNLLGRLGKRSWMYREGTRSVWVIETSWHPESPQAISTCREAAAFIRGYFDAEGGVPADKHDRFYVQFVQKDYADLARVRDLLGLLDVQCGRLHNPSVRQDADYWRFYVLAASHRQFIRAVGSWHPRKRMLLDERALSPPVVRRHR